MKRCLLAVLVLVGCTPAPAPPGPDDAILEPMPGPELPAYRRWSEHIAQGGTPTAEGFARLRADGFATVLSVDGALPDAEDAERHGLHTVHVPIGYDGIDRDEALRIVKAAESSPGPIYIHCHHGHHRGPAAAMLARIAVDGVTPEQAVRDLKDSHCSPDYAGLYRDVGAFELPGAEELEQVSELPSQVSPEGLQSEMVAVDAIWDRLKACKAAGWIAPVDQPDVVPAHEALMLRERFRELARTGEVSEQGAAFAELLGGAEAGAQGLEDALRAGADPAAAFGALGQSCKQCHKRYRDG